MTPFLRLYSWRAVCMSEAGTLEKRDIVCVFGCVWVCFGVRERERACTFQLHACVFGFEVAAPAQPPPSSSSSSLRPSSQQCQCAWENMWGEEKEEQEGGDPAYLQPVADMESVGCRADTQNTIRSIFALARLVCSVKGCTVGTARDIFNLQ